MKAKLLFIAVYFLSSTVFGTAQDPDIIIYNGQEYALLCNPMQIYFNQYPEKRPQKGLFSSANWRGYIATFEVIDEQLFFIDIVILVEDTTNMEIPLKWKSVMNEIFPDQAFIKVDWITGQLILPYGEEIEYVHLGYNSTYEHYLLLEIENGNFIKERHFNYKEYELFKEKQFQSFKNTDEYKKVEAIMREDNDSEAIDNYVRTFYKEKYTLLILPE
jgi:hypothetical protein